MLEVNSGRTDDTEHDLRRFEAFTLPLDPVDAWFFNSFLRSCVGTVPMPLYGSQSAEPRSYFPPIP